MSLLDKLQELAESIAQYYAHPRRCAWADRGELQQEAWVAMLAAVPRFDPGLGEIEQYLGAVARNAVLAWLRRDRTLTSGGMRTPARWVFAPTPANLDLDGLPLPSSTPEEDLHDARWGGTAERLVRTKVIEAGGRLAAEVLLDGVPPSEVARRRAVDVGEVYRAAARARAAVESSYQLWRLMRER